MCFEHIEIVFEVEHQLVPTVAAGVTCDAAALVPDLDRRRGEFDLHVCAWRQWCRIAIRPCFDAAQPIDLPEADVHQVEALASQRQQMLALDGQRLTHRLLATVDAARLVLAATGQQHGVELVQVARRGHRDEMVAAEDPYLAFDTSFFMPFAWGTEARLKLPMRAERHEALRLLAAEAAQDFLHRRAKVVVAQPAERAPR